MLGELKSLIAKLKSEGSFVRNISIASGWNIVGISVQFILSPIITRLFTPEEYGVFAVYNSIVLNVAMFNTWRYSETIILTANNKQRDNAIILSLILVCITTLLSAAGIVIFRNQLSIFLGSAEVTAWFYWIPLSVFLSGVFEIMLYIHARNANFFINGLSGFILNITSRGFTILFALFYRPIAIGLIGGDLMGKISSSFTLLFSFKSFWLRFKELFRMADVKSILALAKIYRHFPIYNLPSNLLLSLSSHMPIYFFQIQFNSAIVGTYALSSSLLEIINRLIPYSISTAFLQKAVQLKKESLSVLSKGTFRLFSYFLIAALLIYSGIALLSHIAFPILFGSNWIVAGKFASILSLSYSANFISISLSEVFKVIEKQKIFFITTMISVLLKISAITCSILLNLDPISALWWFSIAGAVGSAAQIITIFIQLNFRPLIVGITLTLMLTLVAIVISLSL